MPKAATAETAKSLNELCDLLSYDLLTGKISWKVKRNGYRGSVKPGVEAGSIDKYGYRMIVIDGFVYPAHRLAWYIYYGEWPTKQVDHINMKPLDNRIENLRLASMTQQRANQRVRSDSISGLKGVKFQGKRWGARIKGINLGIFDTPEAAHEAYKAAALVHFGEFARAE